MDMVTQESPNAVEKTQEKRDREFTKKPGHLDIKYDGPQDRTPALESAVTVRANIPRVAGRALRVSGARGEPMAAMGRGFGLHVRAGGGGHTGSGIHLIAGRRPKRTGLAAAESGGQGRQGRFSGDPAPWSGRGPSTLL